MAVRAVRGAIQADTDTREEILERSAELVAAVLERNGLTADDVISIVFSATPDLTAEFPAYAARLLGLTDVPLLCASEIRGAGRAPAHASAACTHRDRRSHAQLRHVYLRGEAAWRTDLPR
jgi:chorismate mutase